MTTPHTLTAREAASFRTRETARHLIERHAQTLRQMESELRAEEPEVRAEIARRCAHLSADTYHPVTIVCAMVTTSESK